MSDTGPRFLRAFTERGAFADDAPGTPIRFVASTENVARDGWIIEASGWQLENYRANPVVLWAHDMGGARPPIGKGDVFLDGTRLMVDITFDHEDPFAADIERKVRRGFLNGVSVQWDPQEIQPPKGPNQPPRFIKQDLLEISVVPVPADPGALKERQLRAWQAMAAELATDLTPFGEFLPGAVETLLEADDPWERAAADLVALYLPETGVHLPESERKRLYNRACKAYRKADREAPEYRTAAELAPLDADTIAGLFLEDEPTLFPAHFHTETTRAGAVISGRNMADLEQCAALLAGVIERGKKTKPEEPVDEARAHEPAADETTIDPGAAAELLRLIRRAQP